MGGVHMVGVLTAENRGGLVLGASCPLGQPT